LSPAMHVVFNVYRWMVLLGVAIERESSAWTTWQSSLYEFSYPT